jgi:hypothetical protein
MLNHTQLPIGALIEEKTVDSFKIVPVDISTISEIKNNSDKYRPAEITPGTLHRYYGWNREKLRGRDRWVYCDFELTRNWNDTAYHLSYKNMPLKYIKYHHELHLILIALS